MGFIQGPRWKGLYKVEKRIVRQEVLLEKVELLQRAYIQMTDSKHLPCPGSIGRIELKGLMFFPITLLFELRELRKH